MSLIDIFISSVEVAIYSIHELNSNSRFTFSLSADYIDVIMSVMASQFTGFSIAYAIVSSGADQRKHQSSASLAFVRGIPRLPVNSSHKGPVTRKVFPFDDVIMEPGTSKWWVILHSDSVHRQLTNPTQGGNSKHNFSIKSSYNCYTQFTVLKWNVILHNVKLTEHLSFLRLFTNDHCAGGNEYYTAPNCICCDPRLM